MHGTEFFGTAATPGLSGVLIPMVMFVFAFGDVLGLIGKSLAQSYIVQCYRTDYDVSVVSGGREG